MKLLKLNYRTVPRTDKAFNSDKLNQYIVVSDTRKFTIVFKGSSTFTQEVNAVTEISNTEIIMARQ